MGGVIGLTLTACTTDSVFNDMEQQENTTLTNNTNDSGNDKTTFSHDGDYRSIWDIYRRNREMFYHYQTGQVTGATLPCCILE